MSVAYWLATNVPASPVPVVLSVAGDKDILTGHEWHPDRYAVFHAQLMPAVVLTLAALKAKTEAEAIRLWRAAFND